MPIDVSAIRGMTLPSRSITWSEDDVILYHLALGAGDPATDDRQLAYTFEEQLSVLPTFGTIADQRDHLVLLGAEGMDVALTSALHGEQEVTVLAPLPVSGDATVTTRVDDITDKGSGAIVTLVSETTLGDGTLLSVNRSSLFFRGEGGFGNARAAEAAKAVSGHVPDRKPDHLATFRTMPQQALLYRLTGDKALLHASPDVARNLGFDRPILHGLCTFGIACRMAVDTALDGKIELASGFRARFCAPVYPGETLETSIWEMSESEFQVSVMSLDREIEVLSHASLRVR